MKLTLVDVEVTYLVFCSILPKVGLYVCVICILTAKIKRILCLIFSRAGNN